MIKKKKQLCGKVMGPALWKLEDITAHWDQSVFRVFFFSSRRRHTSYWRDWSSDVCSSDLVSRNASSCRNATRSNFTTLRSDRTMRRKESACQSAITGTATVPLGASVGTFGADVLLNDGWLMLLGSPKCRLWRRRRAPSLLP